MRTVYERSSTGTNGPLNSDCRTASDNRSAASRSAAPGTTIKPSGAASGSRWPRKCWTLIQTQSSSKTPMRARPPRAALRNRTLPRARAAGSVGCQTPLCSGLAESR
jgi:hypothetical protein